MVRKIPACRNIPRRFPHARGDGPNISPLKKETPMFSPRPWGWSGLVNAWIRVEHVFPTPVGMVRIPAPTRPPPAGFPHARGDGPGGCGATSSLRSFSPRPWGWSVVASRSPCAGNVFPTPVGMVRCSTSRKSIYHCFPHARGDGPKLRFAAISSAKFSPRPWGWSVNNRVSFSG